MDITLTDHGERFIVALTFSAADHKTYLLPTDHDALMVCRDSERFPDIDDQARDAAVNYLVDAHAAAMARPEPRPVKAPSPKDVEARVSG